MVQACAVNKSVPADQQRICLPADTVDSHQYLGAWIPDTNHAQQPNPPSGLFAWLGLSSVAACRLPKNARCSSLLPINSYRETLRSTTRRRDLITDARWYRFIAWTEGRWERSSVKEVKLRNHCDGDCLTFDLGLQKIVSSHTESTHKSVQTSPHKRWQVERTKASAIACSSSGE